MPLGQQKLVRRYPRVSQRRRRLVGPKATAQADVCFVDPRDVIRIIVNIPGRCSLASKLDASGRRREFACRIINMSTRDMAMIAPVCGTLGERVAAYVPRFGKLEGRITRVLKQGFVMSIMGTED